MLPQYLMLILVFLVVLVIIFLFCWCGLWLDYFFFGETGREARKMPREKLYHQNLEKRITFVCRGCGDTMSFMKGKSRIAIVCKVCKISFFIEPHLKIKNVNIIRWVKN
jgi:hypothetical protein